ncbi:MAG: alanine--tRNA ligase [Bacteroidota bacterium]
MESKLARKTFLDFFQSKGHQIVPSAPIVVKNDPTLMFNNSGMAPFKDIFLGNSPIKFPRIADTQKCLRVSGKHNDLEEVGVDTYHHTMFEMLGNWSFGDYFKKEAIAWAWELLTEVYKLDKSRLYVTVFEGYEPENLAFDQESYDNWKLFIDEDRILRGNKKDNFWEMGDTGPCGPCTEIHIDLRDDEERQKVDGKKFVNESHPQVIEIWNNVFMEFERKANGSLVKLPKQHVDTGMGFERLCMALQGKKSNYDTDVFQPLIKFIEKRTGKIYGKDEKTDIAMRVLSDHIRTIAFAIADGQLPGNAKAAYVIRRILRRAVRYYYTFLDFQQPFLYSMVDVLAKEMGDFFPELNSQKVLIEKVIKEEENSFLKTLGNGILRFEDYIKKNKGAIDGEFAFELFDTFGFPIDLTQLLSRENNLEVDMNKYNECLEEQKKRSRMAAEVSTEDWIELKQNPEFTFVGYTELSSNCTIVKYRKVSAKGKTHYQIVLDKTPFYAESGGQVGDSGWLSNVNEKINVLDTKKENGIWIHITEQFPEKINAEFFAQVDEDRRKLIMNNHSATHLMHAALRNVLGTHVEQKGSLVNQDYLRFDFSHFSKLNEVEVDNIEEMVNQKITENIKLQIEELAIEEAKKRGAMALFGEKYGDVVRVVTFDENYSVELCGGTHVDATGKIGYFKIVSESAVASGVRRIEAYTELKARNFVEEKLKELEEVKSILKNPKSLTKAIEDLIQKNSELEKSLEVFKAKQAVEIKNELLKLVTQKNDINLLQTILKVDSVDTVRDVCYNLSKDIENLVAIIGCEIEGKANISLIISENLTKEKKLHAGNIIKELAKEINGGGGGQAFFATAGGQNPKGLQNAIDRLGEFV